MSAMQVMLNVHTIKIHVNYVALCNVSTVSIVVELMIFVEIVVIEIIMKREGVLLH